MLAVTGVARADYDSFLLRLLKPARLDVCGVSARKKSRDCIGAAIIRLTGGDHASGIVDQCHLRVWNSGSLNVRNGTAYSAEIALSKASHAYQKKR